MSWLQSILYALISGMAEFLPVSSGAHQTILLNLFGQNQTPAALNFTIHLGALAAVYINCQNHLAALSRTQKLLHIPKHRRKRQPDTDLRAELQLFRNSSVLAVIMVLLTSLVSPVADKLYMLSLFLLINGTMLYITGRIAVGNKTAASMTRFDGLLIGVASGLGIVPGISRLGLGVSSGIIRGASAQNALNWGLLISIPVLLALCVADIVLMFTAGVVDFGFIMLLQCLVGALFAYLGAAVSIALLRFMAVKVGFSWFSYYNWGLALFAFLLYMI